MTSLMITDSVEKALQSRANNAAHQKKIEQGKAQLPAMRVRLERWGEWVVSNYSDCGSASSMLAAFADGGGMIVRSTVTAVSMSEEVYDTELAVSRLEPKYKRVVHQKYLRLNCTDAERAGTLGMDRRTFQRYVIASQQQILFYLKAKLCKASVRDSMLQSRQR